MMTFEGLRKQFESMNLSPGGIHYGREGGYALDKLAANWDMHAAENRLVAEVDLCMIWLRQVQRTKHVNERITSYGLKHVVSRWHRDTQCVPDTTGGWYVPNGAFIMAAHLLDFIVKQIPNSPNAWINVSMKAIREPK